MSRKLGLRMWLRRRSIAAPAVWLGFGLTTLIMLAGLHDIPKSYYEVAELEGAGTFVRMWYITIPLMRNVVLYLLVTGFTAQISQFELSLVMTGGGPLSETTTPNLYILNHFRNDVMVGNSIAASRCCSWFWATSRPSSSEY